MDHADTSPRRRFALQRLAKKMSGDRMSKRYSVGDVNIFLPAEHMLLEVVLAMACLLSSSRGHASRQRAPLKCHPLGIKSSKNVHTSSYPWEECRIGVSETTRPVQVLHALRSPDTPVVQAWWKQHDHLWEEITSTEDFWEAVNGSSEQVVFVGTHLLVAFAKALCSVSCSSRRAEPA
jgi:hypothetical protein